MPLIRGKSKSALKKNIETEMDANPSPEKHKQNIAIAYSVQRKAKKKKMAYGGEIDQDTKDDVNDRKDYDDGDEDDDEKVFDTNVMTDDDMEQMNQAREKGMSRGGVADHIMAKRKMADGGMVDLDENAEEEPNNLDDLNHEALEKENYAEENGLSALGEPEDSNEYGHELSDEDAHDMIDAIRKRMRSKRGF